MAGQIARRKPSDLDLIAYPDSSIRVLYQPCCLSGMIPQPQGY